MLIEFEELSIFLSLDISLWADSTVHRIFDLSLIFRIRDIASLINALLIIDYQILVY